MIKSQIPNAGDIIEITDRRCSDNLQPTIKVMYRYRVLGTDKTKQGKDVVIIKSHDNADKTHRINSSRFSWRILSPNEVNELKRQANELTKVHSDRFTNHEMAMLVYHPTMLEMLMWEFVEHARQEAAYYKLSHLKKLSRTLTEIHNNDIRNIHQAMSKYGNLYKNMMECYNDWHTRINQDIVKLFYSVDNVIKRYCPNYPYHTIRTNAMCAKIMLSVLIKHNEDTNKMLDEKNCDYKTPPLTIGLDKLPEILDAYIADNENIDPNDAILLTNCDVFYNRIMAESLPFERLKQ